MRGRERQIAGVPCECGLFRVDAESGDRPSRDRLDGLDPGLVALVPEGTAARAPVKGTRHGSAPRLCDGLAGA